MTIFGPWSYANCPCNLFAILISYLNVVFFKISKDPLLPNPYAKSKVD